MKITAVIFRLMMSSILFPFLHSDIKMHTERVVILNSGRLISQTKGAVRQRAVAVGPLLTTSIMWPGDVRVTIRGRVPLNTTDPRRARHPIQLLMPWCDARDARRVAVAAV